MRLHPRVPDPAKVAAWQEFDADSRRAARRGEFLTDTFHQGDYPGQDDSWAECAKWDAYCRSKAEQSRANPPQPLMTDEPATRSRIPALFRQDPPKWLADLPAFDEASRWASVWVAERGREGLLLVGPTGVGKTGIATFVAQLCGEPNQCSYWEVRALLTAIKNEFGDGQGHTLERAKTKPLLVLDDLGVERGTDYNRDTLRDIVESRFSRSLATVVTTNLHQGKGPGSLQEHLGPRAYGRLIETTRELIVTGEDKRIAS